MTDYCWKKLPYNSGTAVILVWCSKQLKGDFSIFNKSNFLVGRQFTNDTNNVKIPMMFISSSHLFCES